LESLNGYVGNYESTIKTNKGTQSFNHGIIVVSPEYNHGYPGELKMMLDTLYQQYFYSQCPGRTLLFKNFAKSGIGTLEVYNNYINGPSGALAWSPDYVIILAGVMLALALIAGLGFGLAFKDEAKGIIKDVKKKL
jgi:hypothetical protein